jgi:hypothetical protein
MLPDFQCLFRVTINARIGMGVVPPKSGYTPSQPISFTILSHR